MPPVPITGDRLYDFVLVVLLVIIGIGIAFKGGQWWGYILVALAGWWAWQLVQVFM